MNAISTFCDDSGDVPSEVATAEFGWISREGTQWPSWMGVGEYDGRSWRWNNTWNRLVEAVHNRHAAVQ